MGLISRYGMWACCAVMAAPIGFYLLAGGTASGILSKAGLVAPLLACVGLHLVMHRMLGKSCHGKPDEVETVKSEPVADLGGDAAPALPQTK
ncbi:DUF2933 domain-containing protein [Oricola cellulosilytica]|uniref:DUF2933 domain-containing protein n=1 Tax=Oricola cellulosilytica TaxID=1429082 RepID=A0A4V2MPB0_9HYPH|nr:DUF2933 domain-containing protein [Oricola cellulosilytica]TCD13726.1 DUF2933 domain-containing protein [Oricola cellulosilytica]